MAKGQCAGGGVRLLECPDCQKPQPELFHKVLAAYDVCVK
jgi:hypothetical protein